MILSHELVRIIRICFMGSMDLVIGTVCAEIINQIFRTYYPLQPRPAPSERSRYANSKSGDGIGQDIKQVAEDVWDWTKKEVGKVEDWAESKLEAGAKSVVAAADKNWGKTLWMLMWRVFAQLSVTLVAGVGLRETTFGMNPNDPTYGILFILSLFRQPVFWQNVDAAYNYFLWWIGGLAFGTIQDVPAS